MDRVKVFDDYRSLLFSIAYGMLGTVMEAEDILQETFLRWQDVPPDRVQSPKAYLSTIVSNLCIDHLRRAQVQRETYIGPWLPEPLVTDPASSPADMLALSESLSMAFLVMLESLSPDERAVFLLREVFDYDYPTIANMIGKSEANCRQLVSRARKHVAERRPRYEVSAEQQSHVMEQFMASIATGDVEGLLTVLADDVTWWSDGGGQIVGIAQKPVRGAQTVARFILNIASAAPPGTETRLATINGGPGFVTYIDGIPYTAVAIEIVGDRIMAGRAVVNPDKLQKLPLLHDRLE